MVGMTAALIGTAVLGAGAQMIGASKNSKAIKQSTAAQTDANNQANAINLEARNQNVTMQQPFYQSGMAANNRINALLGLGGAPQPVQQPTYSSGGMGASSGMGGFQGGGNDLNGTARPYNMGYNPMMEESYIGGPQPMGATAQPTGQPNELQAAQNAFGDWRENTGYQFRFNEGIRAIDAGAPVRNSGATLKARMQYGQGIGSQEFGNYFGALQDQQRVGVGAANALSGVNTTYSNNAAGLAQQQGQNLANSAVARANNTNSMINGVTSSFTNALGAYGGYKGWG